MAFKRYGKMNNNLETWFCTYVGSHIVSKNIEALKIRGIIHSIFTVQATDKNDAHKKASEVIDKKKIQ
jgi:hypothetical protein